MIKKISIMLCLLLVATASAELLVHEDFEEMTIGEPLPGQTPGLGITGWAEQSGTNGIITNSEDFGSYYAGSQAVMFDKDYGSTRYVSMFTEAGIEIPSGSMYVSYLVNLTIPPEYGRDSYIGWRTRVTDISLRSYVHGSSSNTGVGAAVDNSLVYDNSGNLAGNGTFMVISKFDDLAGAASTADTWAIDAATYDLISPDGITEAELNNNAFLHATQSEGATGVAWFDGQGYDLYLGADCILLLDEVKIGTTLTDVVSNPSLVTAYKPSPSDGATGVFVDTVLSWRKPLDYTASKFVVDFRADDPNWFEDDTIVIESVDDLELDDDPATIEINAPMVLNNLSTYYWRVISTDPAGPTDYESEDWSFRTITAVAKIFAQPISQTVADGTNVQLNVGGVNISSYQWFKDGVALDVGHPDIASFSGSQTDTLSFNASIDTEGTYNCQVDNELITPDTSATAIVMTKRLAGWWKLDGNLEDSVAEVVPGAPVHDGVSVDPNFVAGIDGNGLEFFGDIDSIVTITGTAQFFNFFPQGMTISLWVNFPYTGDWDCMLSKEIDGSSGYALYSHNGDASWVLRGDGTDLNTWGTIADQTWQHVVIVVDFDANIQQWYVNGDDNNAVTNIAGSAVSDYDIVLGARNDGSEAVTGLKMDDLRIYTYPLDAYEVAHLYTDIQTEAKICVNRPGLDVSGPAGDPDCIVNLYDLTELVEQWLDCDIVPTCK